MKLFGRSVGWLQANDIVSCAAAWSFDKENQQHITVNSDEELYFLLSRMLDEISKISGTIVTKLDRGRWQVEGDWEGLKKVHDLLSYSDACVLQSKLSHFTLFTPGSSSVEVQTDPVNTSNDVQIKTEKEEESLQVMKYFQISFPAK